MKRFIFECKCGLSWEFEKMSDKMVWANYKVCPKCAHDKIRKCLEIETVMAQKGSPCPERITKVEEILEKGPFGVYASPYKIKSRYKKSYSREKPHWHQQQDLPYPEPDEEVPSSEELPLK